MLGDALKFLNIPKIDLIFIDPPYATGLMNKSLQKIFEFDKLNENGIIICESKKDLKCQSPYTRTKSCESTDTARLR